LLSELIDFVVSPTPGEAAAFLQAAGESASGGDRSELGSGDAHGQPDALADRSNAQPSISIFAPTERAAIRLKAAYMVGARADGNETTRHFLRPIDVALRANGRSHLGARVEAPAEGPAAFAKPARKAFPATNLWCPGLCR
jgi:hypothetical protein